MQLKHDEKIANFLLVRVFYIAACSINPFVEMFQGFSLCGFGYWRVFDSTNPKNSGIFLFRSI